MRLRLPKVRLPIRVRLTAVFAAITAIVLLGMGSFVFWMVKDGLDAEIDRGLETQSHTVVEALGQSDLLPPGDSVLVAPTEPIVQIYTRSGALSLSRGVAGEARLMPVMSLSALEEKTFFEAKVPTSQEVIDARLLAERAGQGSIVVVGSPLTARDAALTRLSLILWIVGPATLLVTTVIGWRLSGAALKPVEKMRQDAAAITSSETERRLSIPDSGDEVERLGRTLNEMLDRLEEALSRERRLVDDASHELRTPLTTLRMELELALRRSRTREELESALKSAHEESDRLGRLAEDLLVLARVGDGRLPVRREPVDMAGLIAELGEDFSHRAVTEGVELRCANDIPGVVEVDPDRVRQALTNLVDNSLRYTPPGGAVTIAASRRNGSLSLRVSDDGPGFPAEFLDRAFEPFARPDGARSRHAGGTGLGLSIVKAVAESHGGVVSASNRPEGGAEVELELPL